MLFNLVAMATLAVVASVAPAPANALSIESHNFVRNAHVSRHHNVLAKRQPRRCRARPSSDGSSSGGAASTGGGNGNSKPTQAPDQPTQPPAAPTSAPPSSKPASTKKPEPTSAPPAPAPPANTWGKKACIAYVGDHLDIVGLIGGSQKVGW